MPRTVAKASHLGLLDPPLALVPVAVAEGAGDARLCPGDRAGLPPGPGPSPRAGPPPPGDAPVVGHTTSATTRAVAIRAAAMIIQGIAATARVGLTCPLEPSPSRFSHLRRPCPCWRRQLRAPLATR